VFGYALRYESGHSIRTVALRNFWYNFAQYKSGARERLPK